MKIIHMADVHLGACPDASLPWAKEREASIRKTFQSALQVADEIEADYILISGDLFNHPPLLRELKEVDSCFSQLKTAIVILIAGNHDCAPEGSAYASYKWKSRVVFFRQHRFSYARIRKDNVYFYGMSYQTPEDPSPLYDQCRPVNEPGVHILLAHGGDEKHAPIDRKKLAAAGFDYVALGHIHKRSEGPGPIYQPGSLEPLDRTETGRHGFYYAQITPEKKNVTFVPFSSYEYRDLTVQVQKSDTDFLIRRKVSQAVAQEEALNRQGKFPPKLLYNISLSGTRDTDLVIDTSDYDDLGRIVSISDNTEPDLDFDALCHDHKNDMLGMFIEKMRKDESPEGKKALTEGTLALLHSEHPE